MAFSLSPSIDVQEFNLSGVVSTLPSSKTGMVLRSNWGEALKIRSITTESELLEFAGKPTNYNAQDWFNCYNFLNYANSLYVVRPLNTTVENAGVQLTAQTKFASALDISEPDLYNSDVAELTLETMVSQGIRFFNRYATASQPFAVAVCMDKNYWKKPFCSTGVRRLSATSVDTSLDTTESTVVFDYNTLVSGDTFVGPDNTTVYTVTAVDSTSVTVTPALTVDGTNPLVGSLDVESQLTAADKATIASTFASDLIKSDGSLINFNEFFEFQPNWTNGEFAIVVLSLDEDGLYNLYEDEKFIVSKKTNGRDAQNRNIFVDYYLFNNSNAVYSKFDVDTTENINTALVPLVKIQGTTVTNENNEPQWLYPRKKQYLSDGTTFDRWVYDPNGWKQADIQEAFNLFSNPESFDVNILIAHELDMNYSSTIAESRKDCIAIVAPYDYTKMVGKSNSEVTQWLIDEFGSQADLVATTFNAFGSYTAIYGNMKYQYDRFNDVNRWLCIAGDIAGLAAQTDRNRDPWWAVAGLERGKVKNAIRSAFTPNKQNRDDLYVNSINPVIPIPGEGTLIVMGNKTAVSTPSAFMRLHIRRLLITVEKAIATAVRSSQFEFNDEFTRSRVRGIIEPFLRDVKGRRGITDFRVVVDESNNTPQVIDNETMIIDVYIKPAHVAENIVLRMFVTPTGANFEEIIGLAA